MTFKARPARPSLLNEFEAAALLRLDIGTIRRHRWMSTKSRRQIGCRFLRLGRSIRYDVADVMAYIDSCRVHVEGDEVGG